MRFSPLFTSIAVSLAALSTVASQAQNDANAPQPSQQQNSTPPAVPKPPAPPPSVTIIGARDAHGVLGRDVRSPTDEDMGRIVDVIVDRAGLVRAAVIDFGGFLGVGSRKTAIDWKLLDFSQLEHGETVELGLDRSQIEAAPEYKPGKPSPAVVTTPPAPDATQKNP
jgi:hypothetical protein